MRCRAVLQNDVWLALTPQPASALDRGRPIVSALRFLLSLDIELFLFGRIAHARAKIRAQ
jgi:hypothetical protein